MDRLVWLFIAAPLAACSGSAFTANGGSGGSVSGTGGAHQGGSGPHTGGGIGVAGSVSSGGGISVAGASSGGGVTGSGGGVSVGGNIGAGGGATDPCEALWTDYLAKLEEARACQIDATGQCSIDSTLPNRCGCEVLVNSTTSAEAKAAYAELTKAGCVQMICGIFCPAPTQAKCSTDGSGSRAVCMGG